MVSPPLTKCFLWLFKVYISISRVDAARFGSSYLSKFGWDSSKGLGVSGEGRTTHIKVAQKLDMMGIGAAHMKDPNGIAWKQNRDFENLLKRLNESSEGEVKVDPEVTTVEVEVVAEAEAVVGEEEKEEKKEKKEKKEKREKKKDKESKKEKKRKLEEGEGGKEKKKRRRSSEEPQEEDVQMKEPSPPPPAPAPKPVHRFRSYVPHFEAQSRKLIPFFLQTSSSSYRSQKHFLKIISSHL
jgi:Pin2-interacting protein X1